jgi:hypothetical protein
VGRGEGHNRVLVGKPERKNHLENPGVDGRIILKLVLEKWMGHGFERAGSG